MPPRQWYPGVPDSLSMIRREKSPEDLLLAQHILEEYRQAGAVRQVTDPEK